MKHYKPLNHSTHKYTDKRHFVLNRRRAAAFKKLFDEENDRELNTFSAYDCTGLIPSALQNEEQAQSYEDVYPYIVPPAPPRNNSSLQ